MAGVLDLELFDDGLSHHTFLPQVLKVKLGLVELEGRGREISGDIHLPDLTGLAVISNNSLAQPLFCDLANLLGEGSKLHHDTHLGAERNVVWDHLEHKLVVFLLGLLAYS